MRRSKIARKTASNGCMKIDRGTGRRLKARILELLARDDFMSRVEEIDRLPPRRVVNLLFSFLYHTDEQIRWHAVTAMGRVAAHLAAVDMEAGRVVMRRLMWNLNDESGGIGWGTPEAMGEIMARQPQLAREFAHLLVSYIRPEGNTIEFEALQRGVLWGLGRLAGVRPGLLSDAPVLLRPYLDATDAVIRGLAVWTAGFLDTTATRDQLLRLTADSEPIRIYRDGRFWECSIQNLAREALGQGGETGSGGEKAGRDCFSDGKDLF